MAFFSAADPGCLCRIPDPSFFHPGSKIQSLIFIHPGSRGQKDTGSRIRNTGIFRQGYMG
jgi:hypothetical protein